MSQQNQHLTHAMLRKSATTTPKQFQRTWCFGKDGQHAGGAGDLESATVFPGILPFCSTCKSTAVCYKAVLWQKRSLQQSHFPAVNTLTFWTPWVESLLLKKSTLIHLRHAKSFVSRAACKVPHCQKWDCHALLFFALDKAIPRLFSISILIAGKTKTGRAKSNAGACGNLFLELQHDVQNASSCFKSSPKIMRPQKPERMTQTFMC